MTNLAEIIESGSWEAESCRIIEASGLFDEGFYRSETHIAPDESAVAHYLRAGKEASNPRAGFDGSFLGPYYACAGLDGPPFLSWLLLRALDEAAPGDCGTAEARAEVIRSSPYFDPAWVGQNLALGLDPAIFYALVGEPLGQRPCRDFDPQYYLEKYPDLNISGIKALDHFTLHGVHEKRRGTAVIEAAFRDVGDWSFGQAVVVIAHEASRSGAPLLALAMARELSLEHPVVSVLLRGGDIYDNFVECSREIVGPFKYEDFVPTEMRRIAQLIVDRYDPKYIIANSIETCFLVPHLAALGVPVVALVHEFAGYTRPVSKLSDMYHWAAQVVFPADIVLEAACAALPELKTRSNIHVFPQGKVELPTPSIGKKKAEVVLSKSAALLDLEDIPEGLLVLGAGHVQIRKGVDVFLSTAAAVRRLAPDLKFCFAWIGSGYDPDNDMAYSVYLAEQISRSGLEDFVVFLPPSDKIDDLFRKADIFFMSSRLDPQPNVGIDAMSLGLPVIAFEGASGTAEVLLREEATRDLVVPHLDAELAGELVCRLARDEGWRRQMSEAVSELAARTYDMRGYVERVDRLGMNAAELTSLGKGELLADGRIDLEWLSGPGEPMLSPVEGVDLVMQQWAVNGLTRDPANPYFRRPCAGFNPQIYAAKHERECVEAGCNPFVHWRRSGEPKGSWTRSVIVPLPAPRVSALRLALHAHFYYPELALDLALRLSANASSVDLFITTDSRVKAADLAHTFRSHRGAVNVTVCPNRGRDVAPFIDFLKKLEPGAYDLIGHVHGKKSSATDEAMGERWREFLFENLIGRQVAAVDTIAAAVESRSSLGLVMAEDPHLVGWNDNKGLAEGLVNLMNLNIEGGALPDFFDFPLGTMFWARPEALKPLTTVELDYPTEPLPYDGTVLHAIERLIPFVVTSLGFDVDGIRVPGTTW